MQVPLLLLLCFSVAEKLELKTVEDAPPAELKAALKPLVEAKGIQVLEGGKPLMTFHLRKEIPHEATAEQLGNGLTYRELPAGAFLGCVKLNETWTDFRKQEIKPGVYTLRLAFQPKIGDHEGVAPHTEFAVLVPAALDESAEATDASDILKASSKATGEAHVSPMLLFPVPKPADLKEPRLAEKPDGVTVLEIARPAVGEKGTGQIGFAFTVRGVSKER